MANEDEYLYVENRVERAWNIPVADARQLLDMPGAPLDEIVAKLNAQFDGEYGDDPSVVDWFDYPEGQRDRFLGETVTGQRAVAISEALERESDERVKASLQEQRKTKEIAGHVSQAVLSALFDRDINIYAFEGSPPSADEMSAIADEVIAKIGEDQLKPTMVALLGAHVPRPERELQPDSCHRGVIPGRAEYLRWSAACPGGG